MSDLSLLVAEARGAHRLSDAVDGFGAIEANAAFGVIEPGVIVLLDSALEKFFERDALADRMSSSCSRRSRLRTIGARIRRPDRSSPAARSSIRRA